MFRSLVIIVLVFALLVSCSPKKLENEAPAVNEAKANSKFMINLPENHSDGYTWQLKDDFNHRVVQDLDPVWHGNEKGIYFNFKALAKGQTTLTFVKRKFTDTLLVKSFIVKIIGD